MPTLEKVHASIQSSSNGPEARIGDKGGISSNFNYSMAELAYSHNKFDENRILSAYLQCLVPTGNEPEIQDECVLASILMMDNDNSGRLCCLAESLVKCRQGQAVAQGYFQIRCIVGVQLKLACEFKNLELIMLFVNRNAQCATVGQRVRNLLCGNTASALVHQGGVAQFVPPNAWRNATFFRNMPDCVNRHGILFVAHAPSVK